MVVKHNRRSTERCTTWRPLWWYDGAWQQWTRHRYSASPLATSKQRKWEDMILPGHENPRNCVDPDEMKMRWCLSTPRSAEYVLPIAQTTSVTPVSPYNCGRSLTMIMEAMIERVWRCTWRLGLSELRDTLGGRDRASLEMHWDAMIEWVWRCTLRPWSSKVGDAIGDRDWVNSEMHREAVNEWVWRCTCRLWSREIGC